MTCRQLSEPSVKTSRLRASAAWSGPVVRNLIGSEQKCKSLEDIAHFGRSQDAEAISQSGLVDRSDLGDVYDARTRKSGFTLP